MGGNESKEQALFIDIAEHMLNKRGVSVGNAQLKRFFRFVQECAPWFPDQGSLDIKTWKQVGDDIHAYHRRYGNERVPTDVFALWSLFRDCLDPKHESDQFKRKIKTPSQSSGEKPLEGQVLMMSTVKGQAIDDLEGEHDSSEEETDDDQPFPQDEEDLEKAATRYHNPNGPPNLLAQASAPPWTIFTVGSRL